MAVPTRYQTLHPPVQGSISGARIHTPPSIFQHMIGQQSAPNPAAPWPQMPQVPPMMMPWSVPSLQASQLVRFTGERSPTPSYAGRTAPFKRKIDVPDIADVHRPKLFITEERMTDHFRQMRISNDMTAKPDIAEPRASCSSESDVCLDLELETDPGTISGESGKSLHPRLVMSEELKRLQQEPLLPGTLLSKLEKPSMALVLWEPPRKHLGILSARPNMQQFTFNGDSNNNNNNESSENRNSNANAEDSMIAESADETIENRSIIEPRHMLDADNSNLEFMDL